MTNTSPPSSAAKLNRLLSQGLTNFRDGNLVQAKQAFSQAIKINARNFDAVHMFALCHYAEGKFGSALVLIDDALRVNDAHIEALINKGRILESLFRFDEAQTSYRKAWDLAPEQSEPPHNIGRILLQVGKFDKATIALRAAHRLSPQSPAILSDLGAALLETKRYDEAVTILRKAIELNPAELTALQNLGTYLKSKMQIEDAANNFRAALAINPNYAPALINLAIIAGENGDLDAGLELVRKAAKADPKNPEVQQTKATLLLRHEKFRDGFEAYESRFKQSPRMVIRKKVDLPEWKGEDLRTKGILVWTEQGIGDEILSASMISEINERASDCILACSKRLITVFERSFQGATVVDRDKDIPPDATIQMHYHSPSLSLGRQTRRDLNDFPNHEGYLVASDEMVSDVRSKYQKHSGARPLVGLSWHSGARYGQYKNPNLEDWVPIISNTDVQFVSLQYGNRTADISRLEEMSGVKIINDENINPLNNMDAAMAQTAAMDLIVTVSNTTAHMAGSLGKSVWTLLPLGAGAFWYWFRNRTDSPWYPSMRLFRQVQAGDWSGVMQASANALRAL